jgi:hypothetical protein
MPITRAQYLSGDNSQGAILLNQVQGVKQGFGLIIDPDGTIRVDTSAFGTTRFLPLGLASSFNGFSTDFVLVDSTSTAVTPTPQDNIIVFLGGVAQTPVSSYTIVGNMIKFTSAPPAGTEFLALTTVTP